MPPFNTTFPNPLKRDQIVNGGFGVPNIPYSQGTPTEQPNQPNQVVNGRYNSGQFSEPNQIVNGGDGCYSPSVVPFQPAYPMVTYVSSCSSPPEHAGSQYAALISPFVHLEALQAKKPPSPKNALHQILQDRRFETANFTALSSSDHHDHSVNVGAIVGGVVVGSAAGLFVLWLFWRWNKKRQAGGEGGGGGRMAGTGKPSAAVMMANLREKLRKKEKGDGDMEKGTATEEA
ncbi:MAG: hypothetical protein Q9166_004543 [cf. Caloplaca sp. 2 TL-2023]